MPEYSLILNFLSVTLKDIVAGVKITAGHQPFSGPLSTVAAHFLCFSDIFQVKQDWNNLVAKLGGKPTLWYKLDCLSPQQTTLIIAWDVDQP